MLVSLFLSLSSIPSPPPLSLSLSLPVLHVFSINYIQDNRSPNEMKRPGQVTHPPPPTREVPRPRPRPRPQSPLSRVSRLSLSPKLTRRNFVLYSCTVVAELKFPREGAENLPWKTLPLEIWITWVVRIRYTYSSTRVVSYMYLLRRLRLLGGGTAAAW